ncbi:GntR family transcriptional regulator [Irregularibacter muris]|uniref:GntR family transcriptional regulator n=1 Tax=Irregularibacter muris TaxID=1796619 RepID=A0AAE3HGL5_9FIRM|nr:GntR family transcriptional regulator [Irregularibacter muris]MCR1899107.1 GntR family transcriptional regulator [Irregularibacter muris]
MKYINVYKDIKGKILKGIYPPGATLEGEEIFCEMYGLSRTTIRKAIAKLKQDGYVHSRQGSGIFVNPPEFYEEKSLTTISERIDKTENIETTVLDFKTIEADEELSEIFNLSIGSKLFYYTRVRKIVDSHNVLEKTYMPYYLFKDFNKDIIKKSVSKYIEKDCHYTISHDIKNIKAINVDKELAQLLNMEEGSATLQIQHKVYLNKSILAQYTLEIQTKNNIRFVAVR